jgi:hypothetical protein
MIVRNHDGMLRPDEGSPRRFAFRAPRIVATPFALCAPHSPRKLGRITRLRHSFPFGVAVSQSQRKTSPQFASASGQPAASAWPHNAGSRLHPLATGACAGGAGPPAFHPPMRSPAGHGTAPYAAHQYCLAAPSVFNEIRTTCNLRNSCERSFHGPAVDPRHS